VRNWQGHPAVTHWRKWGYTLTLQFSIGNVCSLHATAKTYDGHRLELTLFDGDNCAINLIRHPVGRQRQWR